MSKHSQLFVDIERFCQHLTNLRIKYTNSQSFMPTVNDVKFAIMRTSSYTAMTNIKYEDLTTIPYCLRTNDKKYYYNYSNNYFDIVPDDGDQYVEFITLAEILTYDRKQILKLIEDYKILRMKIIIEKQLAEIDKITSTAIEK